MKKLLGTVLAVITLGVLSVSPVHADTVVIENDGWMFDQIPFHTSLVTGGSGADLYFAVYPSDNDGENGCNLINGGELTVDINVSQPGVVSLNKTTHTFSDCSGYTTVTATPVASGSTEITLSQSSNTSNGSFTYTSTKAIVSVTDVADTTPPVITPIFSSPQSSSGWNNSNVTVSWNIQDEESPIVFTHNCGPTNFTAETDWSEIGCTAISAGGQTDQTTVVKIDKTKPIIFDMAWMSGPQHNGWYTSDVQMNFDCSEQGTIRSEIQTNTVGADLLTTEGANQSITSTGSCIDAAGNSADPVTVHGLNLDKTAPDVTINLPVANAHYAFRTGDLTDWIATDSASGVDFSTANSPDNWFLPAAQAGSYNYILTIKDYAGNEAYVSVPYVVDERDWEVEYDESPPEITPVLSTPPNEQGWHNSSVTLTWDIVDNESAITSTTGCEEQTFTENVSDLQVTCQARSGNDYNGGSRTATINIDKTKPIIVGYPDNMQGIGTWFTSDTNILFSCYEEGSVQSGIGTNTLEGATLTTEGSNQSVTNSGTCIDVAGNVASNATVSGIKIDKTEPTITVNAPVANAHYAYQTGDLTDWIASDSGSGIQEVLTVSAEDGQVIPAESAGSKSFVVSVKDHAGHVAYVSVPYVVDEPVPGSYDATPPEITPHLSSEPNANGWHNGNVTVTWDVTDAESAITSLTGCGETVLTTESNNHVVTCTAKSANGYQTASQGVTVRIDKTKPVIDGYISQNPTSHGWFNSDASANFSCIDPGDEASSVVSHSVASPTLTSEGANQSLTNTGTCIDEAGNEALSKTLTGINIDKTAPALVLTTPVEDAHYAVNSTVLADWSIADPLSGVAEQFASAASGSAILTSNVGAMQFSLSATDKAGNFSTIDRNYTIDP